MTALGERYGMNGQREDGCFQRMETRLKNAENKKSGALRSALATIKFCCAAGYFTVFLSSVTMER